MWVSYVHYQKEMVVDPNGQVSVSYKDLSGKVIATGLAGDAPTNVNALASESDAETSISGLYYSDVVASSNEINVTKELLVSADNTKHKIAYGVDIPRYQNDSFPGFCFDCVYELVISLKDECGEEVLDGDLTVVGNQPITRVLGKPGSDFDVVCEQGELAYSFLTDAEFNDTFITVFLDKGKYSLLKSLRVSDEGADFYVEAMLQHPDIKSLEDFVDEALSEEDTLACELTCTECLNELGSLASYAAARSVELSSIGLSNDEIEQTTKNEYEALYFECQRICDDTSDICGTYYNTCLFDVMPKGGYAQYEYNEMGSLVAEGLLDVSRTNGLSFNYKEYLDNGTWVPMDYRDKDGNPITVTVNGIQQSPNQLSVQDFIDYFTNEWAYTLVTHHPEYCRYQFCNDNISSSQYDEEMLSITTYSEAYTLGFLDPMANLAGFPDNEDPYFAANSSDKTAFNDNYIAEYKTISTSLFTNVDLSLLEFCIYMHYSNQNFVTANQLTQWLNNFDYVPDSMCDARSEAVWEMYKGLYASAKQEYLTDNVICYPNLPSGLERRFYRTSDVGGKVDMDLANTDAQGYSDSAKRRTNAACDTFCENQAEYWLYKLGGCNLSASVQDQLVGEFKKICKNGCDDEHPFGASTTPSGITKRYSTPYNSFKEAFVAIVPITDREPGVCDVWSIAMPKVYASTLSKVAGKVDSCVVDSLVNDTCYSLANENTKKYIQLKRELLAEEECEDCINCEQFQLAKESLHAEYGGFFIDSTWALKEVMTNYFNAYFGFNLNYFDYETFQDECTGFGRKEQNDNAFSFNALEPGVVPKEMRLSIPPSNSNEYFVSLPRDRWLLASSDFSSFIPLGQEAMYTPPNTKYADTCVCNKLQDMLDSFGNSNPNRAYYYNEIKNGDLTHIDSFELFLQESWCGEFVPGQQSDLTRVLLKCRELYKALTGNDLSEDKGWDSESKWFLNNYTANNLDTMTITGNGYCQFNYRRKN
jgi:hypothetical protein